MPPSHSTPAAEPAPAPPLIALAVEGIDWHARMLARAFAALGVRTHAISLRSCAIDTQRPSGLSIAALGDRLPDAVFVRTLSGGTFQAAELRTRIHHT